MAPPPLARSLAAAGLLALASCASSTPAPDPAPDADETAAGSYESPPVHSAAELLPPELAASAVHRVRDPVEMDGFLHVYTIESDFGEIEARGDEVVRLRVRELQALAALEAMSKSQEFAAALVKTAKSPFVATWNLLVHPVDSVVGVPVEAWNTLKRTAQLARGDRGELEDSALAEFIGFEREKRRIAHQLDVDPYTSNKPLQRALNRFAWVSYLGGLPGRFVPFQGERAEDPVDTAVGGARVRDLLLHYSPEDLRRLNRIELAVMGVPGALRVEFLRHPWYSPRHQTVLVEALSSLDLTEDRAAFIEAALTATSEQDALRYQRVAELLRVYAAAREPLDRLEANGATVVARTADGARVIPVVTDHTVWTRPAELFARSLHEAPDAGAPMEAELLITGTLSERARREMEVRGFRVVERAFDALAGESAEAARGTEP